MIVNIKLILINLPVNLPIELVPLNPFFVKFVYQRDVKIDLSYSIIASDCIPKTDLAARSTGLAGKKTSISSCLRA
jgi:hypothetical protein